MARLFPILLRVISLFSLALSLAPSQQQPRQQAQDAQSEELLTLHRQLVEIESISGNEAAVGEFLVGYLQKNGFKVEKQPVKDHGFNVWAWFGDKIPSGTLVTSHLDTVPPFLPYVIHANGNITGRGTVDAKSCVAAQILAAKALRDRPPPPPTGSPDSPSAASQIALLFVVGEETDGEGMRTASSLNRPFRSVVFGEPTEGRLVCGHKGLLSLRVTARGRTAHSGYPWLGVSATGLLLRALDRLRALEHGELELSLDEVRQPRARKVQHQQQAQAQSQNPAAAPPARQRHHRQLFGLPSNHKFGRSTVNIGTLTGGVAANVVAAEASAEVSIRLAGGTAQDARRLIERAVAGVVGVEAAARGATQAAAGSSGGGGAGAGSSSSRPALSPAANPAPPQSPTQQQQTPLEDPGSVTVTWLGDDYGPLELDCDIEGFETTIVNYGTDVPKLEGRHHRFLYGPGSIQVAHTEREFVTVEDLKRSVSDYEKIILKTLRL